MKSFITKIIRNTLIVCFLGIAVLANAREKEQTGQKIKVSGFVYDAATGLPISAAKVNVAEFSAAITEDDGSFSINVYDNSAVLAVSKEEYQTQLVSLKGRTEINVYLWENRFNSVHDVADFHYRKEEISRSTKSISLLDTYDSWKNAGTSAEKLISNVAGLTMKSRSGTPGMGSDMFIRGYSSLFANNQPLIVVDGVIYDNSSYAPSIVNNAFFNPLSFIDVKDIASIVVEKDGGAIYGAKGANGVIYITTKRADKLATTIELTTYGGMNFVPEEVPVLDAEQYRIYLNELLQSQGLTGEEIASMPYMNDDPENENYYRYHNNTNWQKRVFEDSYTSNYGLRISGGDQIAAYSLSVGYLKDDGVVKNTGYSRFNSRLNADIQMSDKFSINASLGISQETRDLVDEGLALTSNPVYLSLIKSPFLYSNIIDANGYVSPNLEDVDQFNIGNPQAIVEGFSAERANYRFFGNLKANYDLTKSLVLSTIVGLTFDKAKENLFSPHVGLANDILKLGIGDNRIASGSDRFNSVYSDTRLSFNKTFNYKHRLSSVGGFRFIMNESGSDRAVTYNSANDQLTSIGDGDKSLAELDGHIGKWNDIAYYLANKYSLNNKYLLSVDVALHGSSRFGDEANGVELFSNQFGIFPAVGLGWIVSSENFMAGLSAVDFFKIRGGYSVNGNDDIGNYAAQLYYIPSQYLFYKGIVRGNIYDPQLQWENVAKANAGFDLTLFNERISITADYFHNTTSNMLTRVPLKPETGFDYYWGNEGEMENTGFDVALKARIFKGAFKWDLGLSVSHYKNKLTKLPVDCYLTEVAGATILSETGKPAGLFYGYKTDGIFSSDAEALESGLLDLKENTSQVPFQGGDVRFVEVKKDNLIDENDRQVIGDPNPDFTGSVTNTFSWKGFTLDALVTYSVGGDVYNYQRAQLESMSGYENQTTAVLNRWTTNGQETNMPRAAFGDPNGNSRFSDRWIEDGSYVRLKAVTLSYKIPIKPNGIKSLELFAKGHNLITFTDYLGWDPDFSSASGTLYQGVDLGLTPQTRSVMLGLKIGL